MKKNAAIAASLGLILFVGTLDHSTGTEVSLSLFYLLPVFIGTWYVGRRAGLAVAFLCGAAALVSDQASGDGLGVLFWNTAVRTTMFILVSLLLSALKRSQSELHKKQSDLLLVADELRHSNRELEQFAASASHDLQEPLRKIVAFGGRIDVTGSNLSEADKEYFLKMKSAAVRMQRLIADLLQLSKVSSSTLTTEEVDLNEVFEEVRQDLEFRILETGGYVETHQLPRIRANRIQMKQLFLNLLSNALKYRKKSEPPRVCITSRLSADQLEIQVKDNGIGFDQKDVERIFRPFDRLQGRSESEGTGLGVPICRKIVERHGGSLVAAGVKGEGATFIVSFPKVHVVASRMQQA